MIHVQSFWQSGIYIYRDNAFLMDIEQLVARGVQGDEVALGSLYRAYHQRMTVICQRIVGDRQVAEELAHDAFLLAFAKMNQLRNPRRFEQWLTSITTNVALRYKERHHEPQMLPLDALADTDITQENTTTEERPLPTMAELMAAVDALPNGYGQVFRLAVIEEMSHKEIAEIMGIAAHSSSSQLTRAKKMLQKSLAQYWLLWLLPLLLPVTYFLLRTDKQPNETKTIATKQDETKKPPVVRPVIPNSPRDTTLRMAVTPINHQQADTMTVSDTIPQRMEQTDTTTSIHEDKSLPDIRHNNDTHIAEILPELPTDNRSHQPKWSIDLAYSGGMNEQSINRPFGFTEKPHLDITSTIPVTFDKWSDYADFLAGYPDDGNHTRDILKQIAQNNASQPSTDCIERKSHHYMPITWSLALRYQLSGRLGLETGLSYSRLTSDFETGSSSNCISEQHTIHYLGIPLKGAYNIYNVRSWNVYGSLGIKMEIPVSGTCHTNYILNGAIEQAEKSTLHAPLQWSVGTGLGLQYNFTPSVGFFAEPSLQYYIPTGSSIETYHTEHPFSFALPLGIRITW